MAIQCTCCGNTVDGKNAVSLSPTILLCKRCIDEASDAVDAGELGARVAVSSGKKISIVHTVNGESLKEVASRLRYDGNYVNLKDKIDSKICLDGWFTPQDLIALGKLLSRE